MVQHKATICLIVAVYTLNLYYAPVYASPASTAGSTADHSQLSRYVVGFHTGQKQQLKHQLQEHGYKVLSEGPGFFTVTHPTAPQAHAIVAHQNDEHGSSSSSSDVSSSSHRRQLIEAAHQQHTERLSQLPGVHSSEQDVRRHLHMRPSALQHPSSTSSSSSSSRTLQAAAVQSGHAKGSTSSSTEGLSKLLGHWHMGQRPRSGFEQWGAEVVDAACASRDVQLEPDVPSGEVIPWGIREVGAWNETLQKLPPKGRTIICVIDSGLWAGHPEYSAAAAAGPQNAFSGCQNSGNCPYDWQSDIVGHGSHVTGTISAPQNGLGVVGVISQGAEVHVVRVWNDSGDVSQGQGPYATDLVLAYSHCLSHLKAEQAKEKGGKKVNMVINMSYGSAGPLTVERMWIERAAQRGDVLFVGSAGNNGTWLDVGKRAAGPASLAGKEPVGQYLSYPASYRLNEMLSVANARCDGSIEFTSQKNKQVSISAPGMAILSSVPRAMGVVRGHINTTAQVTTGATLRMVGYMANGFLEPRAIQGGGISSTPDLPLISCSIHQQPAQRMHIFGRKQDQLPTCAAAKGAICFIEMPGKAHLFEEACAAMTQCFKGGGAGLVVWKAEKGAEADMFYSIPATQLDCGPKCKCWANLKASLGCTDMKSCHKKLVPGVIITPKYAAALKGAGAGKGDVKATVAVYEYPYKYFDGTSMAAPHVSGAAALVWRQFPNCKAADIAKALKMSAQRLPGQLQMPDYAGGYGMLRVDKALQWIQQNNPCAQGDDVAVAV